MLTVFKSMWIEGSSTTHRKVDLKKPTTTSVDEEAEETEALGILEEACSWTDFSSVSLGMNLCPDPSFLEKVARFIPKLDALGLNLSFQLESPPSSHDIVKERTFAKRWRIPSPNSAMGSRGTAVWLN